MMKCIALAGAVLIVCAGPASATLITNIFTGTIVPSDGVGDMTTGDFQNYFGGGNLVGLSFSLELTLDSSKYYTIDNPADPSFITGGTFYSGSNLDNPISAVLTVNNTNIQIMDSSDASYGYGFYGPELRLQAFAYNPGLQLQTLGIVVDLTAFVPVSTSLTTQLPSMQVSNSDFITNYASFYDGHGEMLTLNVTEVNPSPTRVPEPASLAILSAALAALGFARRRRID